MTSKEADGVDEAYRTRSLGSMDVDNIYFGPIHNTAVDASYRTVAPSHCRRLEI